MFLIARAYRLRQNARLALKMADFEQAWKFASEAQAFCSTRKGADLRLLSSWLLSMPGPSVVDPVP
jgi:hypothetical protein